MRPERRHRTTTTRTGTADDGSADQAGRDPGHRRGARAAQAGDYHVLTLTAPGIAELTRPGHFVALGVGGEDSSMLLRRAFSIHSVQSRGVYGGTVEIVFAAHGKGTEWLSRLHRHDHGRHRRAAGPAVRAAEASRCPACSSPAATARRRCSSLADQLRARGCRVDVVLGAATETKLFGVARRQAHRGRRSPSPPRTARSASAAASPTCCPRCSRAPTPTSSTPAVRWRCSQAVAKVADRARRLLASARSRRPWPAASASA